MGLRLGGVGDAGIDAAGKDLLGLVAELSRPNEGAVRVNGRIAALLELGSGFHPDRCEYGRQKSAFFGVRWLWFLPAMLGKQGKHPIREATVHHSAEGMFAIRQGDWKLLLHHGTQLSSFFGQGAQLLARQGLGRDAGVVEDPRARERALWEGVR